MHDVLRRVFPTAEVVHIFINISNSEHSDSFSLYLKRGEAVSAL
jgi:hypothetical protein